MCKLDNNFLHISIIQTLLSRLTPAYIMVLGISQLSSAWFDKTSQFYVYERSHETCAKYWWRNVLYINNFFDINTMVQAHFLLKLCLKYISIKFLFKNCYCSV